MKFETKAILIELDQYLKALLSGSGIHNNEQIFQIGIADPLKSSIEYMLFPSGKRIRPLLCLALVADLNSKLQELIPIAAALELIHTASLIHDDLPAMDNDDFRRGRPSCHKAFNEATAILAGDLMVALALSLPCRTKYNPQIQSAMVLELSQAFINLCNGQQLDLIPSNHQQRDQVEQIHQLKTGALFASTFKLAALGAGVNSQQINDFYQLGMQLGLCFQIADDYIDQFGTAQDRGRPTSSDQKNQKKTFFDLDAKTSFQKFEQHKNALFLQIESLENMIGFKFKASLELIEQILSRVPNFNQ